MSARRSCPAAGLAPAAAGAVGLEGLTSSSGEKSACLRPCTPAQARRTGEGRNTYSREKGNHTMCRNIFVRRFVWKAGEAPYMFRKWGIWGALQALRFSCCVPPFCVFGIWFPATLQAGAFRPVTGGPSSGGFPVFRVGVHKSLDFVLGFEKFCDVGFAGGKVALVRAEAVAVRVCHAIFR